MARNIENEITLVHPYSRNKSDKEDCLFFIIVLINDIYGNHCEIDLSLPVITYPHNIQLFQLQK